MAKRKVDHNFIAEESDAPLKLSRLFSIDEFRASLHRNDAMKSIQDFCNFAEAKESEVDVVTKYLDSGGSIIELVSIIDVTSQSDLTTAMPIFRAIYVILSRIQSLENHYTVDAMPGVEHLLSTYVPAIQAMMALNSAKHRKIVLKMLTTIVTLYPSYGREILNWLALTPQQTEQLLEPGPIRKAFVMFLIAYFLKGDVNLFKPLFDKKGLLSSIIPGLMYDDSVTVTVVLTVLMQKAISNSDVPKTLKLNVFNTQILQSLFGLYNWIGPRGVQKGFKKPKKQVGPDAEAKLLVTSALTQFLRVLCASRKHGVIFWDKALGTGPPLNQLAFTALESVPKPWENEELSDLVVDILLNSPDLIKPYLEKLQQYFEPREASSWTEALGFLAKVIGGLNAEAIIKDAIDCLNQTQLQAAVRSICIPRIIMKHMGGAVSIDKAIAVRYRALCLLTAILQKLNQFVNCLQMLGNWTEKQTLALIHPLGNVLPNMSDIRHMWRTPRDEELSDRSPEECEVYSAIAQYILQVAVLDANLVENPRKLSKLLTKNMESLDDKVKVNVLQAISIFDSSYLAPNSALFEEALKTLLILSRSEETRQDSLTAVVRMLQSTGIFDSNLHEVDLWIGAWLAVDEFAQTTIAQFLVNNIRKCVSSLDNMNVISNGLDLDQICNDGRQPAPLIFSLFTEILRYVDDKKAHLTDFLQRITLKILHFYGPCPHLDEAIRSNKRWLSTSMLSYITNFDTKILAEQQEQELCSWLLGRRKDELNLSQYQLDTYQWCSLFYLTLYHLRQSLLRENFDEEMQSRCKICIEAVLNGINPSATTPTVVLGSSDPAIFFYKCVESLMKDSTLLDNFCVFGEESRLTFTRWLESVFDSLKLVKRDSVKQRGILDTSLLIPWRNKFMVLLKEMLKKQKALKSMDFYFWMEFLQPTVKELEPLIQLMCSDDVPLLAIWGNLFHCLIKEIGSREMSRDLIEIVVERLEKSVFCRGGFGYERALLIILQNFPMSVFQLKSDFLLKVVRHHYSEVSCELFLATELFLQLPGKPDLLLDFALQLSENSCNPWTILFLLDRILKYEDHSCLRGIKVNLDVDVYVIWPAPSATDTKIQKTKIANRIKEALKSLYAAVSKPLKKFIRGTEYENFTEHINIVRILIRLNMKNPDEQKSIRKSLQNGCPRPCLMADIVGRFESSDDSEDILMHCLKALSVASKSEPDWLLHAEAMESLVKCSASSTVWSMFVMTDEFKNFKCETVRQLSLTTDPNKIRMLNAVVTAACKSGWTNEALSGLFYSCTSQNQFLNILLSSNPVKAEIISLILTLIDSCPTVMSLGQVPTFLAAYNGTLSSCDQQLLQILRMYERRCGSLSKFEPLFWGIPAISHYSVRGHVGLSLWRQATMKSVLQLLDLSKVRKSIAEFPLHRSLHGGVEESSRDIYDPAFLLPLFSNLFSPGAISYCLTFIHQGALSLTIAALSSEDASMRGAATVVISRFYSHLQLVQHSKQKPMWLHVIDCLRYGMEDVEKKPIPSIVSVFLARAILEVAEPLGALYSLHNFFLAKSAFSLNIVPEFLPLFFSSDHNHQKHRSWILEVLRDGMRSEVDLNLVVNGPAFKIMLSFFESSLASNDVKCTILEVLQKMVRSPNSSRIILGFGLLSWLRRTCIQVKGSLCEPFFQLVTDVYSVVQHEQRLARAPLRLRVEAVLKQLLARTAFANSKSPVDELARREQAIMNSSKVFNS